MSPGVPDSDLTVVVSTDDTVLRTDQVAAVRRHFNYLHTFTDKSTIISDQTVINQTLNYWQVIDQWSVIDQTHRQLCGGPTVLWFCLRCRSPPDEEEC